MAYPGLGDLAPDFKLPNLAGQTVALSDYRGQSVLLVFMRHLGCLPCREHLLHLLDHEAAFRQMGVQVLTISFSTEHWAHGWSQETGSSFPLLLDPERQSYRAYQLDRSRLRTWGPNVLWRYVKLLLAGERLRPAQGDLYQLGGDFLIDGNGVIQFAHRSKDPVDRPPIDLLLSTLMRMQASPAA